MTRLVRPAAIASGVIGLIADALLVLFYITAKPWTASPNEGWYGRANDILVVWQYLALIPVVLGLGRLVITARLWTRVGLAASVGLVVLQLLLITDVLPFGLQVYPASLCAVASMLWAGAISAAGPLPKSAKVLGRAILIGLPVVLVVFLVGLAVTWYAGIDWAWAAAGIPGALVWILFPVWTLVVGATPGAGGSAVPVSVGRRGQSDG